MQRVCIGNILSTAVASCTLKASAPPGATNVQNIVPSLYYPTTFYAWGNAGLTSVTLQPQIMNEDGTYRDYGPSITGTGAGFIAGSVILGPVLGAQWNCTNAPVGGTVFLEIVTVLV